MKPTTKELDRIKRIAHGAYGYLLTAPEVLLIWRLAYHYRVTTLPTWPPKRILYRISIPGEW